MNISSLHQRIDSVTQSVKENCSGLSEEQLNQKPSPETWSIAQVLEHLILTTHSYDPIFEQVKNGTYRVFWMGKLRFLANFFGNFILKSVRPENKKKIKTFPIWQPSQSKVTDGIVGRFIEQQEYLKKQMTGFENEAKNGRVIHSPANRKIVYKLATAFDILVTHEERHLLQLKEVKERISKNAKEN